MELSSFFHELINSKFIIYCGAGISIPAPSCAPSWWTLTEEILTAIPSDMIIKDPEKQPEVIFENFANMLDVRLYKIFSILDVAEPNAVHYQIAFLAKMGLLKACITTNFDIFIERALEKLQVPYRCLVDNAEYEAYSNTHANDSRFVLCKIHGTISHPESIVSVASAYKSSKGFSIPKAEVISELISQYPLLFLGYSGWDFEHLNYRRFWERVGPSVKKIVWNQRPGESTQVKFSEIFARCWDRFIFSQGDLPEALFEAIKQSNLEIGNTEPLLTSYLQHKEITKELAEIKEKRMKYLQDWVSKLPLPYRYGLVISESHTFSQTYKNTVKASKEAASRRSTISYSNTNTIQEIAAQFSSGKITMEEYQRKIQEYTLKIRLMSIRQDYHERILKLLNENGIPGITDHPILKDVWLGILPPLADAYSFEEMLEITVDIVRKYQKVMNLSSREAIADRSLLMFLPQIMNPEKRLWEPYYKEFLELKAQYVNEKISDAELNSGFQNIVNRFLNNKMGLEIPVLTMFEQLSKIVEETPNDEEFYEGCEALFICNDMIVGFVYSAILQKPDVISLYGDIVNKIKEKRMIERSQFDELDQVFRRLFGKCFTRANNLANKSAWYLLEAALLKFWVQITPYIDANEMKNYQKYWDEGQYPIRLTYPQLYNYIHEKTNIWANNALEVLPPRFQQKILSLFIIIEEGGNNLQLVKYYTDRSLTLTEGQVTEATPMEVPSCLAAFYEKEGNSTEALKYYNLALDGIKSAFPPIWQDVIVYRAALLTSLDTTQPEEQRLKKALKILGAYSPNFYGNAGPLKLPAREKCLDLAERIAKQLNYSDALTGIKELMKS